MSGGMLIISDLPAGMELCGRYAVKEKLADGAMASVYLAADGHTGQDVALKILDPLRGADPVGRARFEREFQVLSQLQHPAIARCLELAHHEDLDILVLEHVPGETLEARMGRGRLPVEEAVKIVVSLAEAVESCHAQGILHRDLKPANVMLAPGRGPVVLDFGVAWFSSAANLTRTGAVIGSPQYLAPEAFASSLVDARADIYSLGAILFEMLTGRPVRTAASVAELAGRHLLDEPTAPSIIRPTVPRDLDPVVLTALAPRPEERFATAAAFARALKGRTALTRARLQSRLPCTHCRTPLILDLAFCPGCGRGVAWKLTAGPYAVQINEVADAARATAWITRRHGDALRTRRALLPQRLMHTPVPLVVGASLETAEQLMAEAREAGCSAEIVRARAVLGARIKSSAATPPEMTAAAVLHFLTASVLGGLLQAFTVDAVGAASPVLAAGVGVVVSWWYVRRPVLACQGDVEERAVDARVEEVRQALGTLQTERARRLAAGAVARVAPVLLEEKGSLARTDLAVDRLVQAVEAVTQLDAHAAYLAGRSRSRLAAELVDARARMERDDPTAVAEVARLEQERQELTEVALAHDLAARHVLEATESVSQALRG